ncbi:MAG: hypothetical protein ACRDGQ_04130 [Candidatus Limnocylindrales bacterium]
MHRIRLAFVVGLSVGLLAACSGSTATNSPAVIAPLTSVAPPSVVASSAVPSNAPTSASPIPSAPPSSSTAPSDLPTAAPTALDPCQVVPVGEASQLAGTTFGPGKESTTKDGTKICTYGANTTNVFTVLVGQAANEAAAQAGKAEAETEIANQATGNVKFSVVSPQIGDGAADYVGSLTISGATIHGAALYGLKGTIFYGFSDLVLGKPGPTKAQIEAEATVIVGRLP